MRLFSSRSPLRGDIIPFYFFFGLVPFIPLVTAVFDAATFFAYIDQSCRDAPTPPTTEGSIKAELSPAGEEMNLLVTAALSNGFDFDLNDRDGGRAGRAFNAFWGQLPGTPSVWDAANTQPVKDQFAQLGDNMQANTYGIYCDASAFEWITTWPADVPGGDDWGNPGDPIPEDEGGGIWYIRDTARRSPHEDAAYFLGPIQDSTGKYTPGPDICTSKDPATGDITLLGGGSLTEDWFIILCPPAFSYPIGDQLASYGSRGALQTGEDLDYFSSLGATMLHEFSHAILATEDHAYRAQCLDLAPTYGAEVARQNADSFKNFALVSFLNNNEWYHGLASSPLEAVVPSTPGVAGRDIPRPRDSLISHKDSPVSPKDSRVVPIAGRRSSRQNSWPNRRQGAVQPKLNATATQSFANTSASSSTLLTLRSSSSSVSISITSNSSILSSSRSSTVRRTGPSSSDTGSRPTGSQTSYTSFSIVSPRSSSSSSSPSSSLSLSLSNPISLPGTASLSTSSDANGGSFTWSGSWTDTETPTPASLSWFDIPTGTVAPSQQTSDAVLLGGLFFALKANRLRFTDPKLKSQYIDDVNKVKDQTIALFNKQDIKPPEAECSTTKKRRRANRMSEKQLRAFLEERALLHDRSIFSGVTNAIKDAVNDISKLISCAVNVVNNLVDSVNKSTPDINLIENLTDSLAAVGEAMDEDPDDDPTKTKPTETKPTSTTHLTQTSTASRTSITSASTTTSSVSRSSSSSSSRPSYKRKTLQGPDAENTASEFLDASDMSKLSSSLTTEILASTTLSKSALTSVSKSASTSAITASSTSKILSTVTSRPLPSSSSSSSSLSSFVSLPPTTKTSVSTSSLIAVRSTTTQAPPSTTTKARPSPTTEIHIWLSYSVASDPSLTWEMLFSKVDGTVNPCTDEETTFNDSSLPDSMQFSPQLYPTGDFDVPKGKGADGCIFHGDGKGPGSVTCGGVSSDCEDDPILKQPNGGVDECTEEMTQYAVLICNVPIPP